MTQLLNFIGPYLVLALLVDRCYGQRSQTLGLSAALFGIYFVVSLMPILNVGIVGLVIGVTGEWSLTTLLLLTYALLQRIQGQPLLPPADKRLLLRTIALFAILFYPFSLGLSLFDPYRLGFQPLLLPALILIGILWAWFRGHRPLAWFVLLVMAGYALGLRQSTNLWDTLFDPLLALYAWGWVIKDLISRRNAVSAE